jgi:hypothetical protein
MKRHFLLLSMGLVLAGSALALQLHHEGGPAAASSTSPIVSASTFAPVQTQAAPATVAVAPKATPKSKVRSVTKKTSAAIRTTQISPAPPTQQQQFFGDDGDHRGPGEGDHHGFGGDDN